MKNTFTTALICVAIFVSCNKNDNTKIDATFCRNLINPIGIDKPEFSWETTSDAYDVTQTAWEIEIASSKDALQNGKADVWSSGKTADNEQIGIAPKGVNFNSGCLYWWHVRIWDKNDKATAWSESASFSIGPKNNEWQAKWITATWEKDMPMPYFRKVFNTNKENAKPERAIVYLSGLGCSDLFLNGQRVDSTRILDPAQTNYEQYALYSTFDITKQLKDGDNCIGIALGDGWYNQDIVWGPGGLSYGKPILLAQLEITYSDGSKQIIATDENWKWTPGATVSTNIYAGETYDANLELDNWSSPSTDCNNWKQSVIAEGDNIPKELRPQLMPPIRMKKTLAAVDMWQDKNGNWIFDFGKNVAGVPVLTVSQPKGTRLKMCMGERLNNDSTINYTSTGNFATGVIQTDEYICNGKGTETWSPRFTYQGYRYLELSGTATKPEKSWIKTAIAHTDVEQHGKFECSDAQINHLHDMALRTMLSNLHGLPTDCPHRERCGWLGDAHAVAPTESFNFDMNLFWMKYLADIHSSSSVFLKNTLYQKLHNNEFYFADKQPGLPFMISPGKRLCGVASPDWGTAVVQLPWHVYMYYGNKEALTLYYDEMKQWVDHVQSDAENDIITYGLGDWCPPDGDDSIECPIPLSSSAFHYLDATIVAKAAGVLGKKDDSTKYAALSERLKTAFIAKFYNETDKSFGGQTANAMALSMGLFPESDKNKISNSAVNEIKKHHDFINTGIFGLGRIGQALSRNGNDETAWKIFTKKGDYSFAYMWENADATTMWELLPISEASKDKCINGKSSLNHPMQAVFDAWFYEDIAGIRPEIPGYKTIRFEPTMTKHLDWAKASVNTPYGMASSDWKHEGNSLKWEITIPVNASGIVVIPTCKNAKINGKTIDLNQPECRLGSGKYEITTEL